MRISKVSVKGLFGKFDHEIPLNKESRITIIHGPNGVGKTITLQLLYGLFSYDYELLGATPFEQFRVDFEKGQFISVEKLETEKRLSIQFDDYSGSTFVPFQPVILDTDGLIHTLADYIPELELIKIGGKPLWTFASNCDDVGGLIVECLDNDLFSFFEEEFFFDREGFFNWYYNESDEYRENRARRTGPFDVIPDWFMCVRKQTRTLFIHTQRLEAGASDRLTLTSDRDKGLVRYISDGSVLSSKLAVEEFSRRFHASLSVYLDKAADLKDLTNLVRFQREFELFQDIINLRLLYKSVEIKDTELKFLSEDVNKSEIPLSALSSGEQHLLVLYYLLLFEVEPDTLIMIDEPELSMNVVWQRNFLKDLQRIIELRKFDVLVATHSPMIIDDKWEWTVALGEKVDN